MQISRLDVKIPPATETEAGAAAGRLRHRLVRHPGPLFALVLVALTAYVLVRPPGQFDGDLIEAIRLFHIEAFEPMLVAANAVTGGPVTFALALIPAAIFLIRRRWLEATTIVTLPVWLSGAWLLAWAVGRPGPEAGITGASESFPSVAVAYATILYVFIWLLAGEVRRGTTRRALRAVSLVLPLLAGVSRIWAEENWIGDVAAGYAYAGLVLSALVPAYLAMRIDLRSLPLVRAADVPHSELEPHAHALTSTVLFHGGTVYKVYNPGFFPRLIYWLSFQAPFAYANNPVALEAAVRRRNLAGLLTEYWYGRSRVARATGVFSVDGQLAIGSEYVEGGVPTGHHAAREFLFNLSSRFDTAGLPTWQIDPRQPRSLGNLLESPSGGLCVIDLESGMVSPLASPRAWMRAIRRARVPLYDDVYFDSTRRYIDRESGAMRERMGGEWLSRLESQLTDAELASDAWHAMEPRLWSRLLRHAFSGFGLRLVASRIETAREKGQREASAWLERSIDLWVSEGRYTAEDANRMRMKLKDPGVQQLLPHFGVHLVIGLVLRFPLGSIARVTYTGGNLLVATLRFTLHRSTWTQFRRAASIHSPLVLIVAAMPGFGTFSYLFSGPGLANAELLRLALDGVGERFPAQIYRRTGLRRLVARPPRQMGGLSPS